MSKEQKLITLDGDVWQVIGQGVSVNGETYCHLASTTRGKQQKNGFYPIQRCTFVSDEVLNEGKA